MSVVAADVDFHENMPRLAPHMPGVRDNLHPNEDGHALIRDAVRDTVAGLFTGVPVAALAALLVVLRAVAKYLRQTQSTFSQEYVETALVGNAAIARQLVELFETRFDPTRFDGEADFRAGERRVSPQFFHIGRAEENPQEAGREGHPKRDDGPCQAHP